MRKAFLGWGVTLQTFFLYVIGGVGLIWPLALVGAFCSYGFCRFICAGFKELWWITGAVLGASVFLFIYSAWGEPSLWEQLVGVSIFKMSQYDSLVSYGQSIWLNKSSTLAMSLFLCSLGLMIALCHKSQQSESSCSSCEEENVEEGESFILGKIEGNGQNYPIADGDVNQGVLILGTTGVGKSVTLRRFMSHAVGHKYPLFVIDGKPVSKDIEVLEHTARKNGVPFYGFNCGNFGSYDPLCQGGPTVIKDKIMALKDYWSSDYYRSLAEDYLQTMIFLLLEAGYRLDFPLLIQGLDVRTLALLLRQKKMQGFQDPLKRLASYGRQELMGLHVHLSVLAHSEMGHFFKSQEQGAFSIASVIQKRGVAYFALPSLQYPHFAKTLGKLVVNDIKASLSSLKLSLPIYVIIDEFSVFAGEQVLNIINMGRELGIHCVLATQGLADLAKVSSVFKDQLLNSVNHMICHRLNDLGSIEACVNWMGKEKSYGVHRVSTKAQKIASFPLSVVEHPRVDPEILHRQLAIGEAVVLSKRRGELPQKIKVFSNGSVGE